MFTISEEGPLLEGYLTMKLIPFIVMSGQASYGQ